MNRTIVLSIVIVFVLSYFSSSSQESYVVKCKMTSEEIMSIQPFNVDQPQFEKARTITESLLQNLELMSIAIDENNKTEIKKLYEMIFAALNSAEIIKMDYSMFNEDIDLIKKQDINN